MQHWSDESGCAEAAARLARRPGLGAASVELHGPLGAGKTTFARYLLRALGITGRIKSPTYAILEIYRSALDIYHFDFYRFDDPQEWEDAGFRDIYAGPGLKLAEWPERAAGLLPPADLAIAIEPLDGEAGPAFEVAPSADDPPAPGAGEAGREPPPRPRRVRFDALTTLGRELLP